MLEFGRHVRNTRAQLYKIKPMNAFFCIQSIIILRSIASQAQVSECEGGKMRGSISGRKLETLLQRKNVQCKIAQNKARIFNVKMILRIIFD